MDIIYSNITAKILIIFSPTITHIEINSLVNYSHSSKNKPISLINLQLVLNNNLSKSAHVDIYLICTNKIKYLKK